MYKLLLCQRYLRTRYIALASIISVTLGVATMIVVNAVMAGFSSEMRMRIQGILSDIIIETPAQQVEDLDLIDRYGYRFGSYSTQLGDYPGSYAAAMTLLIASAPTWEMPEATVVLNLATDAEVRTICDIDLGHLVEITPLPTGAPMETVIAEVLGYTEHLTPSDWAIDLHLAPYVEPYPETGPG